MAWFINVDVNNGYPTNTDFMSDIPTGWTNTNTVGLPANLWRISENVNEGYPYTWWLIAVDNGYVNSTDAIIGGNAVYTYGDTTDDPNTYTNTMPVGQSPKVKTCNKYYALDYENIGYLYKSLVKALDGVPTGELEEYLLSHFLNTSPVDLIVNLKWYPFNFYDLFFDTSDGTKTIFIGDLPMSYDVSGVSYNLVGYKAKANTEFATTFTIGTFNMFRHFDDFRDYEPYTTAEIYIPFCTPITLDLGVAMGHDIVIQMSVDLLTGCCTGIVRLDSVIGTIINTTSGKIGIDLPVNGLDSATYNSQVFNAVQGVKNADMNLYKTYTNAITSGITTATGAFTKAPTTEKTSDLPISSITGGLSTGISNTFSTVGAWQNKINADYQLSHVPKTYTNISAITSMLSMLNPLNTYVIISRPEMLTDLDSYGHTTGYATIYNGTLNVLSGLTVCQSADLSGITATATEKQMILTALQTGVYL